MSRRPTDLAGVRFGRLIAVERINQPSDKKARNALWLCECACGGSIIAQANNLKTGNTTSCGCYQLEVRTKHGMSYTKEYDCYRSSKRRASVLQATPTWANHDEIRMIYAYCPDGYEVDHIEPLQGKDVCGLHVENNLQYLPRSENRKKSNKRI